MTGTVLLLAVLMALGRPARAETLTVRCNRGETLAAAVAQAAPGDTILLTGHCKETVLITTDDLTLTSTSGATIDGQGADQAVLTIDGARRLTLQGLTVQHGLRGVHARRGASVSLTGVAATDNTEQGLRIDDNSTASLTDCTAAKNGFSGILVRDSSSAHFQGTISTQDNGGNGIGVFGASSVDFQGTISSKNNAGAGIGVFGTSSADFQGTLSIQDNDGNGLSVRDSSSAHFQGTISIQHNGGTGIGVAGSSTAAFDGATVTTEKNTYEGIDIREASSVFFNTTRVEAHGNHEDGLQLSYAANISLHGESTVSAWDNGRRGFAILAASSLLAFNSTLEARTNLSDGIVVAAGSMQVSATTVSIEDNGSSGLVVMQSSRLLVYAASKVHTVDNVDSGILVRSMSTVDIAEKSTVLSEKNGILPDEEEAAGLRIAEFSVGTTDPQTKVMLRKNGKALDVEPNSIWAPEGKVEVIK